MPKSAVRFRLSIEDNKTRVGIKVEWIEATPCRAINLASTHDDRIVGERRYGEDDDEGALTADRISGKARFKTNLSGTNNLDPGPEISALQRPSEPTSRKCRRLA